MALQKQVLEFPFDKGLEQKVAHEVAPDGLIETLENVDLSKVGKYVKRNGFGVMTTTSLGPGSVTFGNVLKLASREDELIAISSNAGGLGSGAGSGSSGDTIFSYSDELVGWKAHAKIQRPTAEALYSFAQDSAQFKSADVAKGGDIAVFGFRRGNDGKVKGGVYAHVIDISSDTVVADSVQIQAGVTAVQPNVASVKCICHGNLHFIFWVEEDGSGGDHKVWYSVYDRTNHNAGFSSPVIIISPTVGFNIVEFDVCASTNHLFVAWVASNGNAGMAKWTVANPLGLSLGNVTISTGGAAASISCSTDNIKVHVAWVQTALLTAVSLTRVDLTAFTVDAGPANALTGFTNNVSMALCATLSSSECWVFGWAADGGGNPPMLRWIKMNSATMVGSGSERLCINVKPTVKPFFLNNRLFIGVSGYDSASIAGSSYGHALCEIDVLATSSTITALSTLMPVAAWANDVASPWTTILGSCPNGTMDSSVLYVASPSIFRTFDVFYSQTTTSPVGAWQTYAETGVRLMALNFNDSKRWQTARHGESIIFSGGLPYCFDGLHAYECGHLWRPRILSTVRNAGSAVLPTNTTVYYRVTYEYWDTIQRRWQSVTNLATESSVATGTDTQSVTIVVRAPTVTAMPRGGAFFFGSIRISLWRSKTSSPDEFIYLDQIITQQFTTTNYTFTDSLGESSISANERLYTYGGELENYCPPPCKAICSHRDRVFAINSETNELWYTKPLIVKRGVEWSRYQKLPLFEKGTAVASLESALLLFTLNGVYALQGSGPSITGLPPDAFSKLYQISNEIGCIEQNAAFRTPIGVIFRGRQGLWLVDKSLSLRYIGGAVEQFMASVTEMLSGDVDETKGCIRFLVRQSSTYFVLNYWYDTNRWSYDTCASDTVNTAVVHQGSYYQNRSAVGGGNTAGVWKRSATWGDVNDFYAVKVRTHWLRFGNMSQVKRVWRVLVPLLGKEQSGLTVTINQNFQTTVIGTEQSESFPWSGGIAGGGAGKVQPRVHLAIQKVTGLRVTLLETVENNNKDSEGFEFMGLAFELGLKQGAVKMRQEISK